MIATTGPFGGLDWPELRREATTCRPLLEIKEILFRRPQIRELGALLRVPDQHSRVRFR